MLDRVRSWARRRRLRWLVTAIDVQERFGEVNGNQLAAAVTLMAFIALFPLLVVGSAVLGFVAEADASVTARVIEMLGLRPGGDAATTIRDAIAAAEDSRQTASVVGLLGLAWAGLGLVSAVEHAYNAAWQVRGRGIRGRLYGLLWLLGAAALFLASFGATAALAVLPPALAPLNIAAGLGISFGLWLWTARVLLNRDVGWRALVPGAVLGAVGLELLKLVGAFYVPGMVARASALYGTLGVVFALLAWLLVFGRMLVYAAVLDVVRYERRRGTVLTSLEVPRVPDAPLLDVSRSGRLGS